LHALKLLPDYGILVILQPTSPLRSTADIDKALEKMIEHGAESCVSMVEPDKSPYWAYQLDDQNHIKPLFDPKLVAKQRQNLPTVYMPNGALYIVQTDWLFKNKCLIYEDTLAYVMPKERSIDIDNEHDLTVAELYLDYQAQ
jgi:N-acylneuraminate cytidylyltransferase